MDTRIILVYCLCNDLLKVLRHCEDVQCQWRDAEVMTVAFAAALYYDGNFVDARYVSRTLRQIAAEISV